MREIKFRAWDKTLNMIHCWSAIENHFTLEELLDTNFFEAMQYTGMKDSHGKEIYEGDIIEAVFELLDDDIELKNVMDAGVVVFTSCAFQVQTFSGYEEPLQDWSLLSEELKVIGNKFENPELLPEVPQ